MNLEFTGNQPLNDKSPFGDKVIRTRRVLVLFQVAIWVQPGVIYFSYPFHEITGYHLH